MKKYSTIMFIGMDRVGKDTVRKMFAEHTSQQFITFVRSFVDNFAYDEMFRTAPTDKEIKDVMSDYFHVNPILVYLKLDFDEINRRAFNTEQIVYDIKELKDIEALFGKYLGKAEIYGFRVHLINCNDKTPEQIVEEVYGRIKD